MKNKGVIIILLFAVFAVGGVMWYVLTKDNTTDGITNGAINTNATLMNTNQTPVNATYVPYSGSQANGFTFDTVSEWTSVAPQEVQKSITEEQRNGYDIIYYSTNSDRVVFAVSVKSVDNAPSSLEEIVNGDIASAALQDQSYTVVSKNVGQADAQTIATLATADTQYTVHSRYLGLPAEQYGRPSWVLMEVSVPTNRTATYAEVVSHLQDSLVLATTEAVNAEFSASGEKVNDLLYRQMFSSIELGVVAKNADPTTMRYGISQLNYDTEQNGYRVVTTDALAGTQQLTIKAYDYTAGALFDGSMSMEVKQGSNGQCCYSPPGKGRYQYLFYLGSDLVKVLDLESR